MTVTVTREGTPIANSNDAKYYIASSVGSNEVFVVTFSNGVQIAITAYDEMDSQDFQLGVPTPSGGIDTINLYMWGINGSGSGATFEVYTYSGGSIGTLLYTYVEPTETNASFQFTYNTGTNALAIARDPEGGHIEADGTQYQFSGGSVFTGPACYLAGTRILTPTGPVAIEALRPGDLLATREGGMRPIRWIGRQTLLTLGARGMLAPVHIRPGALGDNQPSSDLRVSPGHAVLVGEHLVCAYLLLNGTTIVQPPHTGEIRYFHLDLGTHDCVLAEGAWAETYYEHLNREAFDNAAEYRARFPASVPQIQPTCLPYVNQPGHPALPALRALVEARAPRPESPHLLADGEILLPEPHSPPGTWHFAIPAGTATLRLRSPAASPAETHGSRDTRRLGLRLRAATLEHAGTTTALDLAAADLADGWHQPETDNGILWRWTNGDAALPFAAPGPATLTLAGYAKRMPPRPERAAA